MKVKRKHNTKNMTSYEKHKYYENLRKNPQKEGFSKVIVLFCMVVLYELYEIFIVK